MLMTWLTRSAEETRPFQHNGGKKGCEGNSGDLRCSCPIVPVNRPMQQPQRDTGSAVKVTNTKLSEIPQNEGLA